MKQQTVKKLFDYDERGFLKLKTTGRRAGWQRPLPSPRRHIQVDKKVFYEHRLIFLWHHGFLPKNVDHINGNGIDNRIENLRAATPSQNSCNIGVTKRNRSGAKGVYWCATNLKWVVQITVRKRRRTIGTFINKEDAILARTKASEKFHRDFARD